MYKLLAAALAALALASLGCHDGYVSREWMHERQAEYLDLATEDPIRPGSLLNVMNHLERQERGEWFEVPEGAIPPDAWDAVFEKLFLLRDTSDFDLLYLMNLLYAHGGHPAVPESLWQEAEQAVLDFKYWYTDPTPDRVFDGQPVIDQMWYWTENHVLLFRVNEFLAGQRYPEHTFTVTGMTGAEHRERARAGILEWMDERVATGFTEWHSDVYYQKDITPLLSLVEWAEDELLVRRAAMLLDVLFLDIALHLHEGNFGATHGRSYVKDKASATTQDAFNGARFLFDDTSLPYSSTSAPDATLLARARHYRLPKVIQRIARHDAPMVDRERMNRPLPEEPDPDPDVDPPPAPDGLDYTDEANLPLWWSMGSQTAWMMVPLTLEVGERENLWQAQFADFKVLRDIVWVDGDLDASVRNARPWLVLLWKLINQSLLKEVNTYTYRTADYMLSTAQDYRKGLRGAQTHISQATLGEQAIVFTQHPTYLPVAPGQPVPPDWNWQKEDEPGPGYWSGDGAQPRSAQYENVAVHLYAPQYDPFPLLALTYRQETHAYFPQAHFDEVVQGGGWTFGRKGDGYVALWSLRPTVWRSGQPEVFDNQGLPFDLVAPGSAQNVWIVECGSAGEWGSFASFQAAILASQVTTAPVPDQEGDGLPDGHHVWYDSPSQGEIEFSWHGPLVVRGQSVPIADYPRFDNPFVTAEFGSEHYQVSDGEYRLELDFASNQRRAWGLGAR
ncbi:MAG: hypothetical protein ACQGVC_24550 [Myxococcota bacterium]